MLLGGTTLNYPDDFNVPTFAAGKSIAVSRAMGIGIMSGFLIVIFLCGILIWTMRSVRVEPYILTTGGVNDEWQIVKSGQERPTIEMTTNQAIQESVAWKFVQNWFTISNETDINTNMWDTSCERSDCDTSDGTSPCQLFCVTSDNLFKRFKEDILPSYTTHFDAGEYWAPITKSIRIAPVGSVNDAGGTWRVQMSIMTSTNQILNVMAYAKIAKNVKTYPKTMGYYIADFNAYRIN